MWLLVNAPRFGRVVVLTVAQQIMSPWKKSQMSQQDFQHADFCLRCLSKWHLQRKTGETWRGGRFSGCGWAGMSSLYQLHNDVTTPDDAGIKRKDKKEQQTHGRHFGYSSHGPHRRSYKCVSLSSVFRRTPVETLLARCLKLSSSAAPSLLWFCFLSQILVLIKELM